MFYEMLNLVIETVAGIFAGFLLLRFWMQALKIRPPSSLGQAIFQLTDRVVLPLRRLVPGFFGLDWASLIAAYFVALLVYLFASIFTGNVNFPMLMILALARLLQWVIYGLMALIIIEAILSFVNPHAPLAPVIRALNSPLLQPFRRLIPAFGGIDFSPLFALLLLQVVNRLLAEALPRLLFYTL